MDWRFLLFTEPSQIASHWLTYQWKLHWAWKWALPASWGATAMKRPECMVKSLARKGSCCLETGTYKLSLQRLNHDYYWIQHILKGIQGGYQKLDTRSVLWEKYDKTSLQNVGCFLAKFFFFLFSLSLGGIRWLKMAEELVDMEYITLYGCIRNIPSDTNVLAEHQLRVGMSTWTPEKKI